MGENAGFAPLTVAVLNGALGTSVGVGLSTVDGSARGIYMFVLVLFHVVYHILPLFRFV